MKKINNGRIPMNKYILYSDIFAYLYVRKNLVPQIKVASA